MTLNEVLQLCKTFNVLDTDTLLSYLNRSYNEVKQMISVRPVILSLKNNTVSKYASATLTNATLRDSDDNEYCIKEIIDIVGETPVSEYIDGADTNGVIVVNEEEIPTYTGDYFLSNNHLIISGTVNVYCYLYPTLIRGICSDIVKDQLDEECNPILILPLISKMFQYYYESLHAEQSATMYADLCDRICNLRNSQLNNPKFTQYTTSLISSDRGAVNAFNL